jgi:hypothetical protein
MKRKLFNNCLDYEAEFARWRAENDIERFAWRQPRMSYDDARRTFKLMRRQGWQISQLDDQRKKSQSSLKYPYSLNQTQS